MSAPCAALSLIHVGVYGQSTTHHDNSPHAHARRFMAFDRHMNLVLGDAEEYRKLPPKKGKSEDEVPSHLSFPSQLLPVHMKRVHIHRAATAAEQKPNCSINIER